MNLKTKEIYRESWGAACLSVARQLSCPIPDVIGSNEEGKKSNPLPACRVGRHIIINFFRDRKNSPSRLPW